MWDQQANMWSHQADMWIEAKNARELIEATSQKMELMKIYINELMQDMQERGKNISIYANKIEHQNPGYIGSLFKNKL